jgi:mevalonate pyrophosphate decarboxylase
MKSAQSKRDSAEKALMARSAEFKEPFETWVKEVRADGELLLKRIEEDGLRRIAGTIKLETLNYEKLTNKTERALVELFLRGDARWSSAMKAIDELRAEEDKIQQQIPHVMVMRDEKKRETHI